MRAVWIFLLVLVSMLGAVIAKSAFGSTPAGFAVQNIFGIIFTSLAFAAWTGARNIRIPGRTSTTLVATSLDATDRSGVHNLTRDTRRQSIMSDEPRFSWLFPVSVTLAGWALVTAIVALVNSGNLEGIDAVGGFLQGLGWVLIAILPVGHGILVYTAIAYSTSGDSCLSLLAMGLAALISTIVGWNIATLIISGQTLFDWWTPS